MAVAARRTAVAAALICLCAPVAVAGAEDQRPTARASLECGGVTTNNGGVADYLNIIGDKMSCRVARKVARRAKGKKYTAFGWTCKKPKRSEATGSLFYACHKGQTGIGFRYAKP